MREAVRSDRNLVLNVSGARRLVEMIVVSTE